ncbi:MAG: exonuclease VII small subunit [bacterium]|jgi:exonuclease VII small subunit
MIFPQLNMAIEKKTITFETIEPASLEQYFIKMEASNVELEKKVQDILRGQKSLEAKIREFEKYINTLEGNQSEILGKVTKTATSSQMEDRLSQVKRDMMSILSPQLEDINSRMGQVLKAIK